MEYIGREAWLGLGTSRNGYMVGSSTVVIGSPGNDDTPRETWFFLHRLLGLSAVGLGIYQISSGLSLYAQLFQTQSMVNYYYVFVVLFIVSLIALKVWVTVEENKARQGLAQAVSTMEPKPLEENGLDDEDGGIAGTIT